MICDKVWKNCFIKHFKIPSRWRNCDADSVFPATQDLFVVKAPDSEIPMLLNSIKDKEHLFRVEQASKSIKICNQNIDLIVSRNGNFVQYFPYLNFNEVGSAWEKVNQFEFHNFQDLDRIYPPSKHFNAFDIYNVTGDI